MKNTTPTVYGEYLQHCQFIGASFEVIPYTTLNQKLGFLTNAVPVGNELPDIGWACIGNQGHRSVNQGQQSWNTGRQHSPVDASPFNMIPFHVRPINDDLSLSMRQQYAGRVIRNVNGVDRVLYYLKAVNKATAIPKMVIIETINGVENIRPFVPNDANLNPTPTDLAPEEVSVANGQKVATRSVIPFVLSASEIQAIIDGQALLNDNVMLAEISEISLVSGIPRVTQGVAANGGTLEYTEVAVAQCVSHLITHYSLPFVNNQVREDLVLGTSNPLMGPPLP